ncbi:MAG TPA: hypothetical protein VG452_07245, partial [Egibacteraceae bacterium]|nr:hypothetical protein [Egibacteraceae bacterium]
RGVRARTDNASPYAAFVRNWSSEGFRAYVDALGRLLDRLVASPLQPSVAGAFSRVVRFELRFWDAVHAGETWDSRAGV